MSGLSKAEFTLISSEQYYLDESDPNYNHNEYSEWLNERSLQTTKITGELADVLRDYYNLSGDVLIKELGEAGGYSEWTQE